ncbi:phosphoribosylglycinamide formyltransferase [Chungangia koreensis]|uniref:Phosphoribosylglycinamide formyltransferase n=1 Tax=Chungangia koreensis TaxID=752657 RepID=A0ABV8X3Z8_9LACT
MERTNIAVFASESGSNFQALHEAIQCGELNARIALVVTDKPHAFVVQRADKAGIPVLAISPKDYPTKAEYEAFITTELKRHEVEWIVLAGYMRLIGPTLLSEFKGQILNIHPSLLPAFPGKDAIGQALSHGVKVTGVTVHYVDEGMDTGPIIAQQAVEVIEGDRELTEKAIHEAEHTLYKNTLNKLFSKSLAKR